MNTHLPTLWKAALASADKQTYTDTWSKTLPLLSPAKIERIWDAAHRTPAEIRRMTGLSQAKYADQFCIPKPTVQSWEYRYGSCPDYVRLMIQLLLDLI